MCVSPSSRVLLLSRNYTTVKNVVSFDEISPPLIISWDQTKIHYIPDSSWTMEKKGTKRIELAGKEDKSQLTAVFEA